MNRSESENWSWRWTIPRFIAILTTLTVMNRKYSPEMRERALLMLANARPDHPVPSLPEERNESQADSDRG